MRSVSLCSDKQATTSFTQFDYTTLTERIYSLVANNLTQFIMEQYLSDCLINPSEETLDYVDSFFEE